MSDETAAPKSTVDTILGAAIKRCNTLEERAWETRHPRDVLERLCRKELLQARRAATKHARAFLVRLATELGIDPNLTEKERAHAGQ